MEKLALMILRQIQRDNPEIPESRLKIMKFGLECLIGDFSKLLAYFIIFWLLSVPEYYLVSVLCYCGVRAAGGGYHEETYFRCFITSFVIFSVIIFCSYRFPLDTVPRAFILILSLIVAYLFAPVDHPNKPIISEERRRRLKYLTCILMVSTGAGSFLFNKTIATTMVNSIAMVSVMLPIGVWANKTRQRRKL
jgi:accessory gene regulator B